jgi:cyclopropane-fatty-acyl-phospholipid synthase
MSYSCALWRNASDLEAAQVNKLDLHLKWSGAVRATSLLDVGCGWGSMLKRARSLDGTRRIVGLTLSEEQAKYVRTSISDVEVRIESWEHHRPDVPYGAIVSVGALEHFVKPTTPPDARIRIYSRFFELCAGWLEVGGCLSLQTSAYQDGRFRSGAISSIFPESDLPTLGQIVAAIPSTLELVRVRNDREDYARTCSSWLGRLRTRRDEAIAEIGASRVQDYESFLSAAVKGFEAGVFSLLRIQLRRIG